MVRALVGKGGEAAFWSDYATARDETKHVMNVPDTFFTPRVFGEDRAHASLDFKNSSDYESVFPNFLRSRVFFPLDSLFSFLPRVISAA